MVKKEKIKEKVTANSLPAIVIIVLISLMVLAKISINHNQKLQLEVDHNNLTQEIFVAPNSQREVYKPAEKQMMLSSFVENISQSLLSFSKERSARQYEEISQYMSSAMLSRFISYRSKDLWRLDSLNAASFVLDKKLTEILEQDSRIDAKTGREVKEYIITVKGKRTFIYKGKIVGPEPQEITFSVEEIMNSEANPYGFVLTKFELSKIRNIK